VAERGPVRRRSMLLAMWAGIRVVREGRRRRGDRRIVWGRDRGSGILLGMEPTAPRGVPVERQGAAGAVLDLEGGSVLGFSTGARSRYTGEGRGVGGMGRKGARRTGREDDERTGGIGGGVIRAGAQKVRRAEDVEERKGDGEYGAEYGAERNRESGG